VLRPVSPRIGVQAVPPAGLAGPDAVDQLAPVLPEVVLADQRCPAGHRTGDVLSEPLAEGGQGKSRRTILVEDRERRKDAEQPAQGGGIGARGLGQVARAAPAVTDQSRKAQNGEDVDGLGGLKGVDQTQELAPELSSVLAHGSGV